MKKLFTLLFLLLAVLSHAEYFTIDEYNVYIRLNKNSSFEVREEITVNFTSPRHGIFRKIPIEYLQDITSINFDRMNFGSKKYKISIYNVDVEGSPFVKSKDGVYLKIRIGDKNKFVSGTQKYVINYKVYGAINFFEKNSEFYWNIIGHEWDTPIKKSSFSIQFPEELIIDNNILILYGSLGSKAAIDKYEYNKKLLKVEDIPYLYPRQGVTVAIRFPEGYLQKGSLYLNTRLFFANNWGIFVPITVFLIAHLIWLKFGRDEDTIKVIQYFPPEGITPAEAGVIIDDKTDNRDIISLIFYWASKGIIKIEEIKGEGFFEKDDYILTKLKNLPQNAKRHEKILFNGLFETQDNVVVSSLKNRFHTTISSVRSALDNDIEESKIYYKESRIFQIIFIIGAFFLGFLTFPMMGIGGLNNAFYFGLATAILIVYSVIMPRKTKIGIEKYKYLVGFREFLDKTEKSKLQYLINEDPNYFDKTLPYAVAFNMLDKWVEKFEGILREPPKWFVSHSGVFHPHNFGRTLSHSVSTMASNFTSAPKSAGSGGSGFSGGFSGGGFGGGGGGSW